MNYYNEFDPKAAAWLRELIKEGYIPNGHVDERSIAVVAPDDLAGFTQCHFFAGIGGWSYALQLAGWPEDKPVWTGSCPCQPYSSAGKGKGNADERNLWPVFFNLIRQCRPLTVFGEQVENAIGHGWLDGISADLEGEGYACGAAVLGAHSVGAPHRRQRLYWVADAQRNARESRGVANQSREGNGATEEGAHAQSGRCGDPGGVGNPDSPGSQGRERQELRECSGKQAAGAGGASGGVADSNCDCNGGEEGHRGEKVVSSINREVELGSWKLRRASNPLCGFWSDYDLIPCRDGKSRRVPQSVFHSMVDGLPPPLDILRHGGFSQTEIEEIELASKGFPLAGKLPGRTMLLKAYGNAVIPQLAAEFIEAWREAGFPLTSPGRGI